MYNPATRTPSYLQLLLFAILLFFQTPEIQKELFNHYDTESGLSNNIVYGFLQDEQGFMWIATENGLNRFDGYEFKKFFHSANDSHSLSSNIIRSIIEDDDGNIWIGTYNGLNLFDRKTQTFTRFVELPNNSINRLDLKEMTLDSHGRIWFNTLSTAGWFDISAKKFHFLPSIENPFSMSLDSEENVWVQSRTGALFKYISDMDSLVIVQNDPSFIFSPILWGSFSNKLWSQYKQEDIRNVNSATIPMLPKNTAPLNILEKTENVLLIGSDIGLFAYSELSNTLLNLDFGEKSSSLTNSIRGIYQDKQGGIWVGTLSGFFHFDPFQKPFSHLDLVDERSDVIMGIHQNSEKLFVNTFSKGLQKYDLQTQNVEKLVFEKEQESGFYQMWDIEYVEESEYPIWLATNEGLFLFNEKTDKLKKINLNSDNEGYPVIFSIEKTEQEFIWVSSLTALYKLQKSNGELIQAVTANGEIISSIQDIELVGKELYISTEGEGIFVYNKKNSEFLEPLQNTIKNANLLLTTPVWDLFVSSDSTIWIGSNQGLFKFDLRELELVSVSEKNKLKNRVIFSIEEDNQNNLWLATEKGLVKFEPKIQRITEFNKADGVVNIEFNRRSISKSPDGRMFFGGVDGITVFKPSEIISNPIIPPVHMLGVQVITQDSVFTPEGFYTKEIALGWNQNTIEFTFTAVNFTNPTQNQYKYKLEGYDPEWVVGNVSRSARYVQLPHGEYKFVVQASNNDGVWNTKGASVSITISPPFWKTIWFKILMILLTGLILWSAYKYRVGKLLEIERVKLRIAGDLHDEVGSGLSGIALSGDILQRQFDAGEIKPELVHRISKNSRALASSLDTIVWLIDPKKESLGDFVSKSLITAKDLLQGKKIEFKTTIEVEDQKKVLTPVLRRNLFLLFKEALHNIVKHSEAERVTIQFCKEGSFLVMKIKDDGKGFDKDTAQNGRGLGTMNSRAEELGSKLRITSDRKNGTEISVSIKIP